MFSFLIGVVLGAVACSLIFLHRLAQSAPKPEAPTAELSRTLAERDLAGRLKAVVETAVDGIITIDESGMIETVNRATERIFGYGSEEMIGKNVRLLMRKAGKAELGDREDQTDQRPVIGTSREVVGRRKNGTEFPLDLTINETLLAGRRFYTGVIRDMTERKRAEEALMTAKEEAERANRAKDQFLAVMSHELRTPLNAITGYADLMDAGVYGQVTSEQENALERIKASSRHLIGIIDQVLTFARSEKELHAPRYKNIRVADLIAEVAAMAEPLAAAKGLRFRVHAPVAGVEFETDDGMVRQILINLVSNAIKFTDYGEIAMIAHLTNGQLALRVADTGRGIPPEFRERIFEPFWQLDRSHTRVAGGSGLGLTVTKRLITALHGDIHLKSELRKGSIFTVEIPAPRVDHAARTI